MMTTADPTRCPRDGSPVELLYLGTFPSHVCRTCGGLWIDRTHLQEYFGRPVDPWRPETLSVGRRFVRHPDLRCECGSDLLMDRHRRHGIEVDACRRCGRYWLDGGELEAMVDRVADRSRAREKGQDDARGFAAMVAEEAATGMVGAILEALAESLLDSL